jgi:glutaredoxin 3
MNPQCIDKENMMNEVLIYTSASCPYCVQAKRLLQEKGMTYTEIRVDLDENAREEMIARSGRRTVPQMFIDDKHIGGCDDLHAYLKA